MNRPCEHGKGNKWWKTEEKKYDRKDFRGINRCIDMAYVYAEEI